MISPNLDDYLKQGMYGSKQLKPEEQKLFLGTYRERVILALTKQQVFSKKYDKVITTALQTRGDTRLLLNGGLKFNALSPYMRLAQDLGKSFTIVHGFDQTEYGLIVGADTYVDIEDITVE